MVGRDAIASRRSRQALPFFRKLGRKIIRMQVGGDDLRFRFVKPLEIGDDAAERGMGLLRFQIADVLAEENLIADRERDSVFQMRADGQNDFGVKSWRVASRCVGSAN